MARDRTATTRLDPWLAELWARTVAAELAQWGHGILAPHPPSGGVAVSGLANARGCCGSPMQIERCTGTFASPSAASTHSSCLACRRRLAVTLWVSWDGIAASAVHDALARCEPGAFDPPAGADILTTRSPSRLPWRRTAPQPTPLSPRRTQRAQRAWNAAGLPTPQAAVEAAEQGRGACQSILAAGAADRCKTLLETLTRRGEPITELPTTAVAPLRVCTEETHGLTLFEPELIIGDTPGLVTVSYLQPLDAHDRPVAPADEPAPPGSRRTRGDERDWPHSVSSEPAGRLDDVDAVALTLRCIPADLVVAAVRRPRSSQNLTQLWAQALNGAYNGIHEPPNITRRITMITSASRLRLQRHPRAAEHHGSEVAVRRSSREPAAQRARRHRAPAAQRHPTEPRHHQVTTASRHSERHITARSALAQLTGHPAVTFHVDGRKMVGAIELHPDEQRRRQQAGVAAVTDTALLHGLWLLNPFGAVPAACLPANKVSLLRANPQLAHHDSGGFRRVYQPPATLRAVAFADNSARSSIERALRFTPIVSRFAIVAPPRRPLSGELTSLAREWLVGVATAAPDLPPNVLVPPGAPVTGVPSVYRWWVAELAYDALLRGDSTPAR